MRSLVVVMLVSGSVAWAEQPEGSGLPLTVGSKVRVRAAASAEPVVGLVIAVDEHVLTLAGREGVPMKIPRGSISAAEMRVGRRGHTLLGLAIGAGAGLALGLAAPVDPVRCHSDVNYSCSRGEAIGYTAVGGAGAGALIGYLIKSDRWARVDVAAGVMESRAGPGLGFTLRF